MFAGLLPLDLAPIVQQQVLQDPQVLPHVAALLAALPNTKAPQDTIHLSNLVKQTNPRPHHQLRHRQENSLPPLCPPISCYRDCTVRPFSIEREKLQWAGCALQREETVLVDLQLIAVAERFKTTEIRFWGKILGTELNYYVLQGVVAPVASLEQTPKGAEKRGEGANYYTFWVANTLLFPQWIELPLITPDHISIARKIKRYFSGHLDAPVPSDPPFPGLEKHYLKAQLARMTHSLELVPKGIFKPNDDNPKVIEYEEEAKLPEFSQLATLEGWAHRNQNILQLGRCTHYVDPSLPEEQIQAVTAQLAEKDPEVQRLKLITEDKLPEGNALGVENVWQVRVAGDSQVFQRQEASSVYGVVVLRSVHWPGWLTVGYVLIQNIQNNGFSNFYIGSGHKWTQPAWHSIENNTLAEEAEETEDFPEPNPKDEPKPVEPPAEEAPPEQ